MAKNKVRYVEAPAKNDVYVGMLIVMNLAMLFGVALLALECNDYDWESQPKGGPTINLPSVTRAAPVAGPADAGGFPAAPADGGGVAPNPPAPPPAPPANEMGTAKPAEAPAPALPIPPVVASNPDAAPAPKPAPSTPLKQADTGPRPGFNPYLPR